jgi:DNA-binding XRE family transcriptional regulator
MPQGTQVSMASVIEVQKQSINRLTEENVMLQAALLDKERQIEAITQAKQE